MSIRTSFSRLFENRAMLVDGTLNSDPMTGSLSFTYATWNQHRATGSLVQVTYDHQYAANGPHLSKWPLHSGPIDQTMLAWHEFAAQSPFWGEECGEGDVRVRVGDSNGFIKPTSARLIGHLQIVRHMTLADPSVSDMYDRLDGLLRSLIKQQEGVVGLFS